MNAGSRPFPCLMMRTRNDRLFVCMHMPSREPQYASAKAEAVVVSHEQSVIRGKCPHAALVHAAAYVIDRLPRTSTGAQRTIFVTKKDKAIKSRVDSLNGSEILISKGLTVFLCECGPNKACIYRFAKCGQTQN